MEHWKEEWAKGGRIWTKTTPPKVQIAIILSDGGWETNSLRLHEGQLQRAQFSSKSGSTAGLDQCLAWVRQLLSESGEPEFDEAEAALVLIGK